MNEREGKCDSSCIDLIVVYFHNTHHYSIRIVIIDASITKKIDGNNQRCRHER